MINAITTVQILRGSWTDPYILNKNPTDPFDGGKRQLMQGDFVQSLDEYLTDFKPNENIKVDFEGDRTGNERYDVDFRVDEQARILYREEIKFRCIAVIERGIHLFKAHLDSRVEKLYLPAIKEGKIPDDPIYKRFADDLRFEDEGRLEKFFTEAVKKAILHTERKDNETLFKLVEELIPEKINEFLSNLSQKDKDVLSYGIRQSLKQALLRIDELYVPAIEQGVIPDTPEYNKKIVELGYKDRDELKERLFYFLRYSLCLTNWNEDDALRTDERAFRSCLD